MVFLFLLSSSTLVVVIVLVVPLVPVPPSLLPHARVKQNLRRSSLLVHGEKVLVQVVALAVGWLCFPGVFFVVVAVVPRLHVLEI